MKKLKLQFVDFWPGFVPEKSVFVEMLSPLYELELSSAPDFIIYSHFGSQHLSFSGPRVFFGTENLRPDFNVADYALAFDRMQFGDRYFRFPIYCHDRPAVLRQLAMRKVDSNEPPRTAFCDYIYSNPGPDPTRTQFFDLLSGRRSVTAAGRHRNNTGYLVKDKLAFQRQFRFSIAFENSSTPGYTTEKIVDAFAAGSVPVYWGDPDVVRDFNPSAFVNVHDFHSLEAVADEVLRLESDGAAYEEMRQQPVFVHPVPHYGIEGDVAKFLQNIFDQEPEKAIRRNRVFWGLAYEVQRKKAAYFLKRLERDRIFSFVQHLRLWGWKHLWEIFLQKRETRRLGRSQGTLPWK